MPIRAKLTLFSSLVTAVVLAATGYILYSNFKTNVYDTLDANLRARAATIADAIDTQSSLLGPNQALLGSPDGFLQVLTPERLYTSTELLSQPVLPPDATDGLERDRYYNARVLTTEGTKKARVLATPARTGIVIVGTTLEDTRESLNRLLVLLFIGGAITLGLAASVSWALAGAALRPVERMRAEAAAISAGRPGSRLSVPGTDDEIARLGRTLNDMLDRLEEAFERERRFVDDASHELRTPLGILRTELELALRRSRTAEELEAALRSAAEESDRLNRLAEDLLVLARADRGLLHADRAPVDLRSLLEEVAGGFAGRAAERGVEFEIRAEPATAELDALRVRQAVANLVDNALRHVPDGGRIELSAEPAGSGCTIEVADNGPGFPPDFVERAFEPFARPSEGRSRGEGGAGLGLAIVRAVAESHSGAAEALNRPGGGALVRLNLPPDAPSAAAS